MTATNPILIELQRKAKDATKNVTAAKKAATAAKNAIGDYFKQRLRICVGKGLLVYITYGWESHDSKFYLSIDNNKICIHYRNEYAWITEVDTLDDYMSRLEFDIYNLKKLYEENGEEFYKSQMNEKKDRYGLLESIINILYN